MASRSAPIATPLCDWPVDDGDAPWAEEAVHEREGHDGTKSAWVARTATCLGASLLFLTKQVDAYVVAAVRASAGCG